MTPGEPKLRKDLVVSRQEAADGPVFVVKDPASGRFFRFREAEHFIAKQLDGSTPLQLIQQRVEERFGGPAKPETLGQFIGRLGQLGLLEAEGPEPGPRAAPPGWVRGNPLYLRFPAFDPDRLFTRLLPLVRFCFTPSFLGFSTALILFAFGIAVVHWGEIGRDLPRLYRFETLFLAWLTVLAVSTAHEFAHGLTCKYFGGEVREIGFMLIYFRPAFYCNVSDAWLFPEKAKRLWVSFAGGFCELFLWALATLAWRVTEPETWPHFLALIVMTTSGLTTFFNLNPLIKLDGYYLLSDALGIPNLRQRSFGYIRAGIRRLWGSVNPGGPDATARERRVYLVYGLLAGAYSFSLLGLITWHFGGFLVERYQGLGFLLFSAFAMAMFGNPFKKVLPRLSALLGLAVGGGTPGKRRARILAACLPLLAVLFLARLELKVAGEFTVLPIHNADVRAEVEGIIEEIHMEEGHLVNKGDVIARLSGRDYRAELRKVEAEIAEKRAKLRMLQAGPRGEEIELARKEIDTARTRQQEASKRYTESKRMQAERLAKAKTTIEKAEERLKYAGSYLATFQSLFAEKAVSGKQIKEAEEQVAVRAKELEEVQAELQLVLADDLAEVGQAVALAEKQLEEGKQKLNLLLAGSRPEEIEATEAEITRLEAQRGYLVDQLQRVQVASPIAGVITTPRLKEKIGQHVKKGDLIAEVHEVKVLTAEIALSEKEIADVQVGQPVVLKARAYPEKTFTGRVTAIAPAAVAEEQGRAGKIVRVRTEIENPSLLLKPEMTGHAKIYAGKRRIVELLTRRLARYVRVEFWSWW